MRAPLICDDDRAELARSHQEGNTIKISTPEYQTDKIELEKDIYSLALIGLVLCFCEVPNDENWSEEVKEKARVVKYNPGFWAAYAIQAYTLLLLSLLAQFFIVYYLWHHAHYNVKIEEIDTDGYLRVVANVVFFCIMAGEARVTHQMWQYIHWSEKLENYKIFVWVVIVVLWLPKLIVAVSLWIVGTHWLTLSQHNTDLILNSVALDYVVQIDNMAALLLVSNSEIKDYNQILGNVKITQWRRAVLLNKFVTGGLVMSMIVLMMYCEGYRNERDRCYGIVARRCV